MCLIVDNNAAQRVFVDPDDDDYGPLHRLLFHPTKTRCRIVYGGRLTQEYAGNRRVAAAVVALLRAGRARRVSDATLNAKTVEVSDGGELESDDPHIIALAVLSGVRLLCSHDADLCRDFRNPKIISKPRGNIYRGEAHNDLLASKCKGLS